MREECQRPSKAVLHYVMFRAKWQYSVINGRDKQNKNDLSLVTFSEEPIVLNVVIKQHMQKRMKIKHTIVSCDVGFVPKCRSIAVKFQSWDLWTVRKENI